MSKRPTIDAAFLAAMIDAAPGRVRKRLDRDGGAAERWEWAREGSIWTVTAGDETVRLSVGEDGGVNSIESVSCSCLLSPKCFHLLACVTILTIREGESGTHDPESETPSFSDTPSSSETQSHGETAVVDVEVTAEMRSAAEHSLLTLEGLLVSGARASGLITQSSLLRAAHQARSLSMWNHASALIRVIEGIQRLRGENDHADSDALCRDVIASIDTAIDLKRHSFLHPAKLGFARRPYYPVSVKRLRGVVAEPILTLSGYAGVVVHLIGQDGGLYQIVQSRPADAAFVGQVYRGGIDLGGLTASAESLSRARIDVQDMTSSPDGRLGKGKQTRWAIVASDGNRGDTDHGMPGRWAKSPAEQIRGVFESAKQSQEMPRGGWDLILVRGTILGAHGQSVILEFDDGVRLNLGIAIDHATLCFRENLQLLARCVGLKVELFGRVRLHQAGWIDALSFRELNGDMVLPDAWDGRCHLGLDLLKRHYLRKADRFALEVDDRRGLKTGPAATVEPELFPGLMRRCRTLVVGGRGAVGAISAATHRRDRARLESRGQVTAAQLLDVLAVACSDDSSDGVGAGVTSAPRALQRTFTLAMVHAYCEASRRQYQRRKWLRLLGGDEGDR